MIAEPHSRASKSPEPGRGVHRGRLAIGAIALGVVASVSVAVATRPPAPGITGDSFFYIGGANSLLKSGKLAYPDWEWSSADTIQPMTRITPALSLALAGLMSAGVSEIVAARTVQSISAGVTVGLAALLVGDLAGLTAGMMTALTILVLPAFQGVHLYVLTEPLFLAWALVAMWTLISRGSATLAGIAFLAATMTRYVGVSLAAGAALALLVGRGDLKTKILRAIAVVGPSGLFFVGWRYWTAQAAGAQPIKAQGLFPLGDEPAHAARALATWIVPGSMPALRLLQVVAMVGCAVAVLVGMRMRSKPDVPQRARRDGDAFGRARALTAAVLTMTTCYWAFVVLAHVLAEPTIEFRERMLLPTFVLGQLWIGAVVAPRIRGRWAQGFGLVALTIWLAVTARVALARVAAERRVGLELASERYRTSPTLRWLSTNARERLVYTNHPLAVYHHARRPAKFWPKVVPPDSAETLARRMAAGALVVAFQTPDAWTAVAPTHELASAVPLRAVATFDDAVVYALARARFTSAP